MAEPVALEGALAAALAQRSGSAVEVVVHERATVGLSQESWFVSLRCDEAPGATPAVLRLPTRASGPRSIVRQRHALQAVAGVVPAPRLLHHDDGADNPLGCPYLVMERIAGEVPVTWDAVAQPARARLAAQAVDLLAALHAVDPARWAPGADEPSRSATALAFYARRLERLGELPPVLRVALWWLARHDPGPPARPAIVHGDLRMGNLVVRGERIVGVLDWEMSGLGDPLADLVWCLIPVWSGPGLDEPALWDRYAAATGGAVDPARLRWQLVLAHVRLTYYSLSGAGAFAAGASDDLRLAALRLHLPVRLDRLAAALDGDLAGAAW